MFSLDKYKMGALVLALTLCGSALFACDSSSKTAPESPNATDPVLDSQVQSMTNQGKHG